MKTFWILFFFFNKYFKENLIIMTFLQIHVIMHILFIAMQIKYFRLFKNETFFI